jgi:hypothetical protein
VQISGTARGEGRAAASGTPDNGYWGPKTVLDSGELTQWGPYRASNGDHYTFQLSGTTLQARKAAFIDGDRTLDLDGTDDYASAPDTGWTVGGGDLDLRANLVTDWQTLAAGTSALVNKRDSASDSNQSFIWSLQTNQRLRVNWNETGGTARLATSSTGITAADGDRLSVRVTIDVDNGAGQYEVKFWTSPDTDLENATWTQLGTTVTGTSGVSSVRDTNSDLMAGAYLSGAANPVNELDGQVYSVRVFDGGTLVEGFDANDTSIGGGTIPGLGTSASTWTLQNNAAIISGAYGTIGGTQTTGLGNDSAHDEIQGAWNYEYGEMQFVVIDRYSGGSSGWICDTHGLRFLPSSDSWSTAAIETGYEVTIDFDSGIDVAYDEAEGAAYFTTIGPSEFITATWWRRLSAARWNGSSWDWFNAGKIGPSFESIAAPQGSFSGATRVYAMSGGSSVNDLYALDNSTRSASSESTQQEHLDEGPGAAFDGSTFGADAESPGEIIQRTEGDPAGAPSSKTPAGWGSAEFPTGWTLKVYCGELFAVAHSSADAHVSYSKLESAAGTWRAAMDVDRDEATFTNARLLMVDKDDRGVADTLWLVWEDGTDTCYREWIKFGACVTAVARGEGRANAAGARGAFATAAARGEGRTAALGAVDVTGIAAGGGEGRASVLGTRNALASAAASGEGRAALVGTVSGAGDVAGTAAGLGEGRASVVATVDVAGVLTARGEGRALVVAISGEVGIHLGRGEGRASVLGTVERPVAALASGEGRASVLASVDAVATSAGRGEGRSSVVATADHPASAAGHGEGRAAVVATVGPEGDIAGFPAGRGEGRSSAVGIVEVQASAAGRGEGRSGAVGIVERPVAAEARGEGRASVLGTVERPITIAGRGEGRTDARSQDLVRVYVRVFKADATTPITDELQIAIDTELSGQGTRFTLPLSNIAAGLTEAEWNAALLRIRYEYANTAAPKIEVRTVAARLAVHYQEESTATGRGEGQASAAGTLDVGAPTAGLGEGRASASGTVDVPTFAAGHGEGRASVLATVGAEGDVAAAPEARGEGRAAVVATVETTATPAARGEGRASVVGTSDEVGIHLGRGEGRASVVGTVSGAGDVAGFAAGLGEGRASAVGIIGIATSATGRGEGRAAAVGVPGGVINASPRGEGRASAVGTVDVQGIAAASGEGKADARAILEVRGVATGRGEGRSAAGVIVNRRLSGLTASVTVGPRLTGTFGIGPSLSGSVTLSPRLTATLTLMGGAYVNEIFLANDNYFTLNDLFDVKAQQLSDTATVTWALKDDLGATVASGSMASLGSGGDYDATIEDDVALVANQPYDLVVNADAGGDLLLEATKRVFAQVRMFPTQNE